MGSEAPSFLVVMLGQKSVGSCRNKKNKEGFPRGGGKESAASVFERRVFGRM